MRPFFALPLVLVACSSVAVTSTVVDDPRDAATEAAVADAGSPQVCIPGQQIACACVGGASGAQVCAADGRSLGTCQCPDAGGSMDAGPAPDASTDDVIVPSDPDAAARSYDYAINRFLLNMGAEPPASQGFYGFNLDGRYSPATTALQQATDCSHGDYFSVVDPDQNMGTCANGTAGGGASCRGGVDNQLPNVAQTIQQFQPSLDVQGSLNDNITSGRGVWVVRVSGVNGALGPGLNDPAVTVLVYPFVAPMFAACANIAMPGQTYAIDNRSLLTPGDLSSARLRFDGSIVNGRLRVTPSVEGSAPDLVLPLGIMDAALTLGLYRSQLRFTLGATEGTQGNLGGYMRQTDLLNALTTIPALMQFRDAAAPLIQGFVDVATGTPVSCDNPNGGIGVGLGFSAVSAVVAPMSVAATPRGMCGSGP